MIPIRWEAQALGMFPSLSEHQVLDDCLAEKTPFFRPFFWDGDAARTETAHWASDRFTTAVLFLPVE